MTKIRQFYIIDYCPYREGRRKEQLFTSARYRNNNNYRKQYGRTECRGTFETSVERNRFYDRRLIKYRFTTK